jgi:hypothetical protein
VALEAQGYFYDQVFMLRNSVMTYMRDAVWAYKYYTLSDISIVLDPLKTTIQYQHDSQTILQKVTLCKENYSSDFTREYIRAEAWTSQTDFAISVTFSFQS